MIGHYLLALGPQAEELVMQNVLQNRLFPHSYHTCLVGIAMQAYEAKPRYRWRGNTTEPEIRIETQFDGLCARFGPDRINRCIRQCILANRAHRAINNLLTEREAITATV